jgi:Gas vesicle synthesis protein GvpL/GvpF
MNDGRQVLYLYGIVPGDQPLPASGGAPLEAIHYSRLAAVVELVPAAEFAPELLDQKLQCVDWVALLAHKHTSVLERILHHGPVIPARPCTLFRSVRAVTELLAHNERQLAERLGWFEGRQEWDLKIFCDEARLRATIATSDPAVLAIEAEAAAERPDQADALRKQRDRCVASSVSRSIEAAVDEVLSLATTAIDTRFRSLLPVAVSGRREAMVADVALLMDIVTYPTLHTAVEELSAHLGPEGFAIELTGPWPPYSFCEDHTDTQDLAADELASAALAFEEPR